MKKYSILFILSFLLTATVAYGQSELLGESVNQDFFETIQPQLLEQAANPETSPYDFMLISKRLGVYGDPSSAPVMAMWLGDPAKSYSARNALEEMPFDEALIELRRAVDSVADPVLKAGVIVSLGMRRDRGAVEIILSCLESEDATIAEAAFFALARIADPACRETLLAKWSTDDAKNRLVADLLLMYGDFLRRDANEADAIVVFKNVMEKATVDFFKEAACYQILLRETEESRALAAQWLVGDDEIAFHAALRAAQFVKSDGMTAILIEAFDKVPAERQVAVVAALGDQKNMTAQETLAKALSSDNEAVQAAAVSAFKSSSDQTVFAQLVETAVSGDETMWREVVSVIGVLDETMNPEILQLLEGDDVHQALGAELVGVRKISEARDKLLSLAKNGAESVRVKAIIALGYIADTEVFAFLTDALVVADSQWDPTVIAALNAACGTVSDKKAAADLLVKTTDQLVGKKDKRLAAFKALSLLGGIPAREAVESAALSDDAESRDLATQTLGNWMSPDVAPVLLKLANTPGYPYANRALRGALRLAKQFAMPDWFRRTLVRGALASPACRDREKELADVIIKQYNLDMSIPQTDGQKLLWNVEIVSATYGIPTDPEKSVNVTSKVQEAFFNADSERFGFDQRFNDAFGGDPAPNEFKQLRLTIRYRDTGMEKVFDTAEGAPVTIPSASVNQPE